MPVIPILWPHLLPVLPAVRPCQAVLGPRARPILWPCMGCPGSLQSIEPALCGIGLGGMEPSL